MNENIIHMIDDEEMYIVMDVKRLDIEKGPIESSKSVFLIQMILFICYIQHIDCLISLILNQLDSYQSLP